MSVPWGLAQVGAPEGVGKDSFAVSCCQGSPKGAARACLLLTIITGRVLGPCDFTRGVAGPGHGM